MPVGLYPQPQPYKGWGESVPVPPALVGQGARGLGSSPL
jgi:hypothetical protein